MTGAELITYVRGQTLLDSDDVADSVILAHLNRAIELVGSRFDWPFLEGEDTIAVIADQQPYDWPVGAVRIETITISGKRVRLKKITSTEAWERYGDDPPTAEARAYYLWNDKIVLLENPPASITLKVKFIGQPTLLSTTADSPEWNSQYHRFLGDYAIARLWQREEDQHQEAASDARFEQGINELADFYNRQASSEYAIWGEKADRYRGGGATNMPWLDGVS